MIYILVLAVVFLITVFIFAFTVLIPIGKEYRVARVQTKKVQYHADMIQAEYDKVYSKLKTLQSDNRHVIGAYTRVFNAERFRTVHAKHFESFSLSALSMPTQEGDFATYEVNTSTLINSPQGFYDFLDTVNKSDNIVSVNFPIHFERDANLIKSSFTMHVYAVSKQEGSEAEPMSKME
jgi:hypothetical protein